MKVSEIRELSVDELADKGKVLAEEHCKLRFKNGIRQLDDTAKLKSLRKDIARIKTIINEKMLKSA